MAGQIDARLQDMGITLPEPAALVANYMAYVISGNLIFLSGQIPVVDGQFKFVGKVGGDLSVEDDQAAARLCGINILAQLKRPQSAIKGATSEKNLGQNRFDRCLRAGDRCHGRSSCGRIEGPPKCSPFLHGARLNEQLQPMHSESREHRRSSGC